MGILDNKYRYICGCGLDFVKFLRLVVLIININFIDIIIEVLVFYFVGFRCWFCCLVISFYGIIYSCSCGC